MPESRLDFHRGTPEPRCRGLEDGQVRLASAEPSSLTLLGLVQHLAEVVRWALIHLIEEYALHNGHADILRERIDGTTGA
ncbi:DUF664 domain-containing protein [Streptomyces sp. NPDC052109]|uniref:mycothiol transferase n=1 Tax=Streptomyces sp. NPDC052109 TaxID=3155527 RepID=UPI003429B8D3